MTRDRDDNKQIIGQIVKDVSLLIAPFAPYISEKIYHSFDKNQSNCLLGQNQITKNR